MKSIGPGRGHFETMEVQGDSTNLAGWIYHPDVATTTIALVVDGSAVQEAVPIARETVAADDHHDMTSSLRTAFTS